MFRRTKPLNERVAKAVIDCLKRSNLEGADTIGPETVTNWSASVDANGRVDVHLVLQHPNRCITVHRIAGEPQDG